jgi:hypothetical protein
LRTAVRAKKFFHRSTAIGLVSEDFRRARYRYRVLIDEHQGAIRGARGGLTVTAMTIGHKLDFGIPAELDISAQAFSG